MQLRGKSVLLQKLHMFDAIYNEQKHKLTFTSMKQDIDLRHCIESSVPEVLLPAQALC